MADMVPGAIPGRPWLDQRDDETFFDYIERMARTCSVCGREFPMPKVPSGHADKCTGPGVEEIALCLELNIWPFD